MDEESTDVSNLNVVAPKFNQETESVEVNGVGQAVIGDEKDAYRFWATKCLLTERYKYLAYSSDLGVEIESIIRSGYPREVAESEIKRTITEALLVDPRTVSVDSFTFDWQGDAVTMSFRVESVYGTDIYELTKGGENVGNVRVRAA